MSQSASPPRRRPARQRWTRLCLAGACLAAGMGAAAPGQADSLSAKDVQIVAKALGFLDPPPPGGMVAVVYAGAAGKSDAEVIVAAFGGGVRSGAGTANAKAVDSAALGDGSGYIAIIVAAGTPGDAAMAAAKQHHIPCITGSAALIQGGTCVMSVRSEPKVDITVNHAAAQAAGVSFASAFRMLIHEI